MPTHFDTTRDQCEALAQELGIGVELATALLERGNSAECIAEMSGAERFNEFCNWHGLIDWGPQLWQIVTECQKTDARRTCVDTD